jgi:hypothetical protein
VAPVAVSEPSGRPVTVNWPIIPLSSCCRTWQWNTGAKRYLAAVASRLRVLAFGAAAALVVAGLICAAFVGGLTGEVLAIALITLGLGAVVLLMFLEVGLSEEQDLTRRERSNRDRRG